MTEEDTHPKRLMTLSFIVSSFATQPAGLITSLLLIEIGLTFGVPVGVTGQLRTVSSIVGVFVALLLGVISLRYSSRSLLLTGSVLLIISAVGCAFAWDFTSTARNLLVDGGRCNDDCPDDQYLDWREFSQGEAFQDTRTERSWDLYRLPDLFPFSELHLRCRLGGG